MVAVRIPPPLLIEAAQALSRTAGPRVKTERYGFRPSTEARKPKRLWLPLQTIG